MRPQDLKIGDRIKYKSTGNSVAEGPIHNTDFSEGKVYVLADLKENEHNGLAYGFVVTVPFCNIISKLEEEVKVKEVPVEQPPK